MFICQALSKDEKKVPHALGRDEGQQQTTH